MKAIVTHTSYRLILLPLLMALMCIGALAQANSNLTGIITDQSGAVISGATIVLTDSATGAEFSTISSGTGLYEIAGLNPSSYVLKGDSKRVSDLRANRNCSQCFCDSSRRRQASCRRHFSNCHG